MKKIRVYKYFTTAILILVLSAGVYCSMLMKWVDIVPDVNNVTNTISQNQSEKDIDKHINNDNQNEKDTDENMQQPEGILPNFRAPDFEFNGVEGESTKLSDCKGKPALISFWRLGITESEKQLTELKNLQERMGNYDTPSILAINFGQEKVDIDSFIKENKIKFNAIIDSDQKISEKYSINTLPTTFLIDSNGIISEVWTKAVDEEVILNSIKELEQD